MPLRRFVLFATGLFCGAEGLFAQNPPQPGEIDSPGIYKSTTKLPLPSQDSLKINRWNVYRKNRPRDFIKNLTIDSFGYGGERTEAGYESRQILSPSSFATHGLECPLCLPSPNMMRTRYTLPAFGANPTLHLWRNRTELFSLFGGINAVKPDNYIWDMQRPRSTSFNDAWLMQAITGGRVAVDPGRHLWIGGSAGYLENYGEGKRHWNTVSANATFRFGH